MDQIAGEHPDGLPSQRGVELGCLLRRERGVHQPGRGVAVPIHDELHEQDALVEEHRPRHSKARRVQAVQGVGLLRLPGLVGRGLAVAAAAIHGPLGPGVPDLASLPVGGVVPEAPDVPGPVDLGGHELAGVAHQPDVRLLAALEARDDLVDDAVGEQGFEGAGHPGPEE